MAEAEITTLVVRFTNRMRMDELSSFRGAIIHATEEADVLYHNHEGDDKLRYAYPLIQYKCIDGQAAIVCLGAGVADIERFMATNPSEVRIGNRHEQLSIVRINKEVTSLRLTTEWHSYRVSSYLPFSQENYAQYRNLGRLAERVAMLEHCLVGNILSFAKGMGVYFDGQVKVTLQDIENSQLYEFKRIKMMGFDIVFKTNALLPGYIGLGRKVSFGFGTLTTCETSKI